MSEDRPVIRLHLWLENDSGLFFGMGRAQLLQQIARLGSIRKAAEELGMSYRAAWGKIKKSEEILGVKLVIQNASKREGCQLTEEGRQLLEKYLLWFTIVEQEALKKAEEILPWPVKGFDSDTN